MKKMFKNIINCMFADWNVKTRAEGGRDCGMFKYFDDL